MFGSDTEAPAHPAICEAIIAANTGREASYGADQYTQAAHHALEAVFETRLAIYPCVSGTAANALALASLCPPLSAVMCHRDAHIQCDERGAVGLMANGAPLQLLDGAAGRICPHGLEQALQARKQDFVHQTPAGVLSMTNLTEWGTAYTPDQIAQLTHRAKADGLLVHMDGARFANVVASTGANPAALTWKAGVDALTFGVTKNGGLGCDVVVRFLPTDGQNEAAAWAAHMGAHAKRAGHMPAKMRSLSAQITAMVKDDLWLTLARQANTAARQLADTLQTHFHATLIHPVQGNQVFVNLSEDKAQRLRAGGIGFYPWPGGGYRFVCSWDTDPALIDGALAPLIG